MRALLLAVLLTVLGAFAPTAHGQDAPAPEPELSMDHAVAIALARNRDVIAAKLEIRAAELDKVAASMYPNPVFSYGLGNLVLGEGNTGNPGPKPSFFSQPVHTFAIGDVIDVWAKRSARMHAADEGIRYHQLVVEDALREIVYSVRSAFVDVVRQQSELDLDRETRDRYSETIALSRSRFNAGEISGAELAKIELEGMKYQNAVIDAEEQYNVARQNLAALLGIGTDLPYRVVFPLPNEMPVAIARWTDEALAERPDVRATQAAGRFAGAALTSERREAFPDISAGLSYTHSAFTASGDNPNTLGLTISVPLPIFDRNQAGIGRAVLDAQRVENDALRLNLEVRREVAQAARHVERAQALLAVYERDGMLQRADNALKVAENSYKAGAISLLELLESRRTYIETRGGYLHAQHDYRQAIVDVYHAVGREPKS